MKTQQHFAHVKAHLSGYEANEANGVDCEALRIVLSLILILFLLLL